MKTNNILLVDDDEDDQEIFLEIIGNIDNTVQCAVADNGREAIDYLKASTVLPDIIFLDLNMPIMTGIDCLGVLKQEEHYKAIPVVIFTTSSNPADIEKTKNLGARAYLTKPTDYDKLYKNVQQLLTTDFAVDSFTLL